jgi:lysophospholipase L1-like esterase
VVSVDIAMFTYSHHISGYVLLTIVFTLCCSKSSHTSTIYWLIIIGSLQHDQLHSPKAIAQNMELRILPLGDSITFGEGSTDGNGYRLVLSTLLTKHGNKHEYIGSVKSGTMVNNEHEGHGGFQIVAVGLTGKPDYLQRPNVVLLMAGTNDIVFNNDIKNAPNRLGGVIEDIVAACPDAAILVATLTPLLNPGWTNKIVDYNFAVPGIVLNLANKGNKVALVNMSRVTTTDINPADGIHPTDEGYEKIAAAWYDGILAASDTDWIAKPLPASSQNSSTERTNEEMNILKSQPDTPTTKRPEIHTTWVSDQVVVYSALLVALLVAARKAAGMTLRRYRG